MRLDEAQRKKSATIGKDKYPMPDKEHARLALSFINRGDLTPGQKKIVKTKADKMLGKGRTK